MDGMPLLGVVDMSHFELLKVVGKGGFGKVRSIPYYHTIHHIIISHSNLMVTLLVSNVVGECM
jgi:sterol desaturase/sphingolipid hydroxylase (fatty acid hydroxylase superfamily)